MWGSLGQRPTEGPSPITTMVPCPPPQSGAGTNPSRGAVRVAAGRPGRPQEGWPDARGHRAATKETLAYRRERRRGSGGVVRLPRRWVQMLLTIKDVSTWLNIKSSTLYLWVAQGKIPSRRIHSLIRFEKDMIERWLASFAQLSGPPVHTMRTTSISNLDALIEAAKREVYTPGHGETITPSPTGKE